MTTQKENASPRCPTCGFVMCEEFDQRDGPKGMTLMVPNGRFSCLYCKRTRVNRPQGDA